jgi:hypothetical protein
MSGRQTVEQLRHEIEQDRKLAKAQRVERTRNAKLLGPLEYAPTEKEKPKEREVEPEQ